MSSRTCLAADRVEGGDGLVEQEDGGPADEGLGDPQALAHAARIGGGPGDRPRLAMPDPLEEVAEMACARPSTGSRRGGALRSGSVSRPVIQP